MTDDEFKAAQMKLFDEAASGGQDAAIAWAVFVPLRRMLRLIFGFLCNIVVQLKQTSDRLERIENRLVELKRMA